MSEGTLSHLDKAGRARMVDVSAKPQTDRRAVATGKLICARETLELVLAGRTPKGAVISTAELAGVLAAKQTHALIPLCHPLVLTKISVEITANHNLPGFDILSEVRTVGQTGVEMEALTAASVAGLTLYDMLKAVDKSMRIDAVSVLAKSGGKSCLSTVQQSD
jgi:cyclic pyranopterin phosphate synthase